MQQHPLHEILRSATSDVHARLHNRRGLDAVKARKAGHADYSALLRRVYGFHRPFEVAAGISTERTDWLKADLVVFGIDRGMSFALLQCRHSATALRQATFRRRVTSPKGLRPRRPGSRASARRLASLCLTLLCLALGIGGRLLFNGHGATIGSVWHDYLTQLSSGPKERPAVIEGAIAAFAICEPMARGMGCRI